MFYFGVLAVRCWPVAFHSFLVRSNNLLKLLDFSLPAAQQCSQLGHGALAWGTAEGHSSFDSGRRTVMTQTHIALFGGR